MKKILIALFSVITIAACAQETAIEKELTKIKEAFTKQAVWSLVSVKGYKSNSHKKGFIIGEGEFIIKPGTGYYSSFDNEICISNSSQTLYVDNIEQTIVLLRTGTKQSKNALTPYMDSVKMMTDSMKYEANVEKGVNKLTIFAAGSGISTTEILYNDETGLIKKIVYHYTNTGEDDYGADRIEILYTYKPSETITENQFNTNTYLKKSINGGYQLRDQFGNYKFTVN